MPLDLPVGSESCAAVGYPNQRAGVPLGQLGGIRLLAGRKSNGKKTDQSWQAYRKRMETTFSRITRFFSKRSRP